MNTTLCPSGAPESLSVLSFLCPHGAKIMSIEHFDKAKTLVKQGNLLALAMEQNSDLDWKSIIFDMKKGLLKFALNSTVDTLPTNGNLVQWG